VLFGCAAYRPLDFGEIFPDARAVDQPVLIVIPGLLGSHLTDAETGRTLWPVNLRRLIRGWRVPDLTLPLPDESGVLADPWTPTDILLTSPGHDYYASLVETLAEVGSADAAQGYLQSLDAHFGRALARGKRFHEVLSVPLPDGMQIDYRVIGSDCESTPRRVVRASGEGGENLYLRPEKIPDPVPGVDYAALMREAGDGRVPRSSLLGHLPGENSVSIRNMSCICGLHTDMAASFEVRHNLLNALFE
jgi:hypothetical protein